MVSSTGGRDHAIQGERAVVRGGAVRPRGDRREARVGGNPARGGGPPLRGGGAAVGGRGRRGRRKGDASVRLRGGIYPHLLPDPRRPSGDGRRRFPPGTTLLPQGLRRGGGDPGGRRPADGGVPRDGGVADRGQGSRKRGAGDGGAGKGLRRLRHGRGADDGASAPG